MYEVIVLRDGYSRDDEGEGVHSMRAACTITLVKGPKNIIVDPGSPWEKQLVIDSLKKHGLDCDQINYVVCTHGHSDHIGNLNLFTNAVHIVSYDICFGDQYVSHSFQHGIPYEIDEGRVEVVPTPGHTGSDVTVLVRDTKQGTVAIAGDLFEREEDLDNPHLWQDNSENEEVQQQSRINILKIADMIIPGHGAMFKVTQESKSSLRVVMFYEQKFESVSPSHYEASSSEYVIIEED
ncbi:hypothetical protein FSP39_015730 [Pinctada imbricata]|uniref:Metallo-beta-lactamase domain-containing protein 1 n=1 Tax=Pinctada imbricata TaxID=66713 RepID=A0AA88Y530_PINIB|nr:hypothetical protein FSP39_015730 [Pinctada imbricata]